MKSINMKRLGTLILVGILALTMAVPTFAAGNTTVVSGEYEAITLAVTVPATGDVIINPYGLPVDLKDGTDVVATITKEQITTGAALTISNESKVALSVSADVTGEVPTGSNVVLVESLPTSGDDVGLKNIAAKFEAFAAPSITATTSAADKAKAFAALKSEDAALTAPVLATKQTATGELILRAGTDAGAAQAGGIAFIRLSGDVTKKPTAEWTAPDSGNSVVGDVFTATIAFSFEPAEYAGTVTLTAPATLAASATGTVTVTMPSGVTAKYDTIKWTSDKTANVTVVDATTAPTAPATTVSAVSATVTGVRAGSTAANISLEFEGSDGIIYRGTAEVKCG